MRLLLLEDDALLVEALEEVLTHEGYTVDAFGLVSEAAKSLMVSDYEVAVFDIALPDGSGLELMRHLRNKGITLPVLMLTARDAMDDRVAGLDGGADDYVVKPFHFDELLARLRVLRRRQPMHNVVYRHGDVEFNPATRCVSRRGTPVSLARRETALLELLLENPGRVLSKEYIHGQLYGWEEDVHSNTIEVYVHNLRRLLGTGVIRTVRGVGYVLEPTEVAEFAPP